MCCLRVIGAILVTEDNSRLGIAQLGCAVEDHFEHRLRIGRRAGNHAQDIGRCRLPLERVLRLIEQPHVLDGDHRLIGESLQQLDVTVGKGTGFASGDDDRADGRAISEHRHREDASPASGERDFPWIHRVSEHVLDLRHCASEDRPSRGVVGLRRSRIHLPQYREHLWRVIVVGDEVHQLAVEPVRRAHACAAQAHRAGDDRVENRLHVGRRARDDAQDLARRRLLFQGLGEVRVARFQLLEQAHVLDGDHRLVGERLEQGDLLVGESPGFRPADGDGADRAALAHEGNGEDAAEAPGECGGPLRILVILQHVRDRDHAASQDCPAGPSAPARWHREGLAYGVGPFRIHIRRSHQVDQLAVERRDQRRAGTAQLQRRRPDRLEHGLRIRWRLADDAQDLARRGLLLQGLGEVAIAHFQLIEQAHVLDCTH